ncbi:MAG TPA: hypothetical protein VMV86_01090 [Methanosarcinales archaeon]|nr:hypothetical protein [Methanosarcinales archaeon]
MTPEENFTAAVQNGFKKQRILMQRLEVLSGVGVPDCSYSMEDLPGAGFIEIKRIVAWPKRESTIVQLKHFSPQQKAWMKLHGPFVQRIFLLLQAEKEYMLFPWTVVDQIGGLNKVDMYCLSTANELGCRYWNNRIDYAELKEALRRNHEISPRYIKSDGT